MATTVTLAGTSYDIPAVGDSAWGEQVSSYLVAIASKTLQTTGGTFTLLADVDFGASFGLRSTYYKSRGTVASAGILRLANDQSVGWRNAANGADKLLKVNSSDQLEFDGNPLLTLALGTANYVLKMDSAGTAYEWGAIANANIDASAAIAYSKLDLSDSIVNADVASGAAIAYSKLALTGSIVNADISASADIALSKLAAVTPEYLLFSDANGHVSTASDSYSAAYFALKFGYLANVSSDIQGQLDDKASTALDNVSGTLAIANGGTGQTAATAAFDALGPGTTKGDVVVHDGTNHIRFPVGSDGQVLTADSGETSGLGWTSPLTNPMTTEGDVIIGGTSGAATRLAAATDNRVVRGNGTTVESGQIDDPGFFTSGAVRTDSAPGAAPKVEILSVTSSQRDSIGTALSGTWLQMTGNSVTLTAGIWQLDGEVRVLSDSGSNLIGSCRGHYTTANGNDTSTLPTTISGAGIRLDQAALGNADSGILMGSGNIRDWSMPMSTAYVEVATDTSVYIVPYITCSAGTNHRVQVAVKARRLSGG